MNKDEPRGDTLIIKYQNYRTLFPDVTDRLTVLRLALQPGIYPSG